MSKTKQIVFLKDKSSGCFKLRSDIRAFGYNEKQGQYYVLFKNGDTYLRYNPSNVDVATFARQLDPPFRVVRKGDGELLYKVLGVRVYEGRTNKAYSVVFENGDSKDYPSDYLTVEEHIDDRRSLNVWEYLNEVSKYTVVRLDEDRTVSLADKYSKVDFVAKKSLLEAYLNVESFGNRAVKQSAPIFPFGCNRSQYKAVRNALENEMSIIQGPPGTGKTQTILNILANLLLDGQTMEIVSNNNSAVENVKEKLEAAGLGFICAQLGSVDNKKRFVEGQTGTLPDMESWRMVDADGMRQEVISLSRELQELYECQEKLAMCSESLAEYKRQADRFPEKIEPRRRWNTEMLEKYLLIVGREMAHRSKLSWWTRLRLRFHRLPCSENASDEIQYLLVTAKVDELERQCGDYSASVKGIEAKNERLRELSMSVLKDYLCRKYGADKERKVFSADEIYHDSKAFLREYPVVLSTTFSATSNINQMSRFDYLIMDEASQVDIAAGALALSCARNAVVVGDLKQLPNVVDSRTEEIADAVFAKYGIDEAYRSSANSFLSSLCSLYQEIPQTLLREHYRCDPLIIGFCSKQFYGGKLIPMKKGETEFSPIRVVRTMKGNHARGTVNVRQVETVVQEVLPVLEERFTDIGVIAPYNGQVDALKAAMHATGRNYVVDTVHKFQGRENDAIVLSTVDNQVREFLDDPHLLNVAVSRAKKQFTLVVSADEQPDSNLRDLVDYIEYYQGECVRSKISSIFDLLYEDYTRELLNFYKTHPRVSEYDSENLAYWTIRDVIEDKGIGHLGILMHYPLRHLVTDVSNLTPEQRAYASRSWTHVDFLVYDIVTHKAKMAIEVDGTQYHKRGSKQSARDTMKDAVLASIGLPFIRLSTAGSQERERIASALSRSIG